MAEKGIVIILDGFGYRADSYKNAVKRADMPFYRSLLKRYPNTLLKASGEAVGLPKGYIGNSEVGHLTIGAGRIIKQAVTRINDSIKDGSFFKNRELKNAINMVKKNGSSLHLMGLLSDAGVHSHTDHLFALIKTAKRAKIDYKIHIFSDGRDAAPKSVSSYIQELMRYTDKKHIGTLIGRYYSMDRDNRWKRTRRAFNTLTGRSKSREKDLTLAVRAAYERGETDEFIRPARIGDFEGIKKGDVVIFFNFREDRARQITRLFMDNGYNIFCMYKYDDSFDLPVLFDKIRIKRGLGEVLSRNGVTQLRIGETEKYAHVTYFFNGGEERKFKGEARVIIPSPKVAYYDSSPEMSVIKIEKRILKDMDKYGLVVANIANPDMVGHTGNLEATVKGLGFVDKTLRSIINKALDRGRFVVITADHGNCEEMSGKHTKSHTTNKVPFIIVSDKNIVIRRGNFGISNIASAVLDMMGIKKPAVYGRSLIKRV